MLHQIGVGALGPVFRTYEPTRDRLVAVKVFRLDVTPEQARALADELARAAEAGLFHPSIVEPVAAGLEGTVAFRAEEYVAAESLDVAMRHYAPASLDKALPFVTQIASALDFARAAGVGHGALHPRDIFVTPDEARVTGFGVVDALDRLGLRAPVRRPYSPPERIAGETWSTQADVFSLGVIAFELLTGRRPSGVGEEMGPLTGAALATRTDEIRAVLARAMHANPEERYSTAIGFASALDKAAGLAPSTQPASSEQPVFIKPPAASIVDGDADLKLRAGVQSQDMIAPDVVVPDVGVPDDAAADLPAAETLDAFAAETAPAPGDSPREVARKVIAAREVRKRQAKPKVRPDVMPLPAEDVPLPIEHAALPADAPAISASADMAEEPAADAVTASPVTSFDEEPEAVRAGPAEVLSSGVLASEVPDEPAEMPAVGEIGEVSGVAEVANFAEAAIEREATDRIVGVDEFRLRDAGVAKPDRAWPRASERMATDRIVAPKPPPAPAPDPDVPLFGLDEGHGDRQRIMMLPLAVALILGLLLGYTAGYIVGGRERAASTVAQTPPTPQPQQTPGTTGQTAAKDFSDQAISPTVGRPSTTPPAVSADVPPTAATKAPAARPREAPAVRRGRVVVNSSPSNASVTINGTWSGRTPLTLDDLAFGKYVVRVVEPGYQVARQEISLSPATASRTISVKLRRSATSARPREEAPAAASQATPPVPSTGEIFVDSRPQGARVSIDGKPFGTTPVRVTGQTVGSHTVRLELADHAPWTSPAQVIPGKTARVTGSLERIR